MSGATAGGWPYVTPDDHPLEFPTHSQALANKLEALPPVATGVSTVTTDASGVATLPIPAGYRLAGCLTFGDVARFCVIRGTGASVGVFNHDGTRAASASITFYWVAGK